MLTPGCLAEAITKFQEEMSAKIEHPGIVLETKELVDELTIEIAECIKNFIEKKEKLKTNPILATSVAHRASYCMSAFVTYEWCIYAVAGKHVHHLDQLAKKEKALHVVD